MKRKSREEEFFGFNPVSLVHDFNQAANDYATDQMESLEKFLLSQNLKTTDKKQIKKVHTKQNEWVEMKF
jgi:hypothetical protein